MLLRRLGLRVPSWLQNEKVEKPNIKNDLEGLDGWLVIVGIQLVLILAFLSYLYLIPLSLHLLANPDVWESMTSPGAFVYSIIMSFILLIVYCYLTYLFFRKKKIFPKLYCYTFIFNAIYIYSILFLSTFASPEDQYDSKYAVWFTIMCLICIPYMLMSKRVKATFVN